MKDLQGQIDVPSFLASHMCLYIRYLVRVSCTLHTSMGLLGWLDEHETNLKALLLLAPSQENNRNSMGKK